MSKFYYKPNLFAYQVKLLTFSGLWLPTYKTKRSFIYLAHILFFLIYTEIFYNFSEYIILKDINKNADELIEHVGMLLQHLVGSVKVFRHLFKLRQIQSIMSRLEDDQFDYDSYKDFKPDDIKLKYKIYSKRMSITWFLMVNCVPLSKILPAIVPIVFKSHKNENLDCNELLPYYSWFPFNINTEKNCMLAYFIQDWPMLIYGWHIASEYP